MVNTGDSGRRDDCTTDSKNFRDLDVTLTKKFRTVQRSSTVFLGFSYPQMYMDFSGWV
jgi:hypothetical protein